MTIIVDCTDCAGRGYREEFSGADVALGCVECLACLGSGGVIKPQESERA